MRLKSIELLGFKSFPDKTVLNFEHGVTVIVGPNGSGKSNISDAIRWVLGELSSKNMRSTKMEDVIFGGAASRKAMGYTQVSLLIDNSSSYEDRLPVDFEEVEVTRRYYRTGESEYMINRKTVRLRDIYELFMNTGIGRTGYSIISQGKAAEIVSQKSEERRTIFEEAAGISKFRYKKHESERKLEATKNNLDRVTDILSELEGRVVPLGKEAEKAKRYLEVFESKKRADISLWLYDVKNTHEALEKTENDLAVAAKELEIAEEELRRMENNNDKFFLEQQQNKMLEASSETELRRLEEEKHALESTVMLTEQEMEHLSAQKTTAASSRSERKEALIRSDERVKQAMCRMESESEEEKALQKQFEENDERLEQQQIELYEGEKAADAILTAIAALEKEIMDKRLLLSTIEGASGGQFERKAALESEKEEIAGNVRLISERIAKAKRSIEAYEQKVAEAKSAIAAIEAENAEGEQKRRLLSAERDKLYLHIESKKEKCASLKRMEELFEGYSQSVKHVMKASDDGRLRGICGPISHLIEVKKQYGIAIETTLGGNIQNIICEDEDAAKSAIRLLKENNAGRATFYPISAMRPTPIVPDKTLTEAKGFVGVAHKLIGYDPKYAPVLEYILGRTLVFDTIDNASLTAKAGGYKHRIVTLDGQLINAGGSYTGGSVKRDSGILTRREEIAAIEKEIASLQKTFADKEKELNEHTALLEESEKDAGRKRDFLTLTASLMQAEDTQKKILDTQLDSDNAALAKIENELASLATLADEEQTRKAEIGRDIAAVEDKIASQNNCLSEQKAKNDGKQQQIDALREENSALRIALAEKRKDIAACRTEITLASEEHNALQLQIENDNALITALSLKESAGGDKLTLTREKLQTIAQAAEETKKTCEQLKIQIEEREKKMNALREELKGAATKKELTFKQHTQLQSRFEQLKSESDKISERIWEEYELTYSDAQALDYPKTDASNRAETAKTLSECKNKLRAMGHVNVGAIEEYKEVKEKYDFLKTQSDDLIESRDSLINVIAKLEREMRVMFLDSFEKINANFGEVFRELFGGGKAEIRLEDPDNVLESGIEINVAPPGKIIKSLMQLSGGEQTFVSIALFFAILRVNPTPFCLFDEIESALDEVNVERFAHYIKNYTGKTQFILISHRRGTIERADTLYGVTMYEKGISKILSLDVNEVEQKTGVKTN
ncbi:MAG: chromosome segregation protein SMC [Ruminococcaceae bacterium]|nr:chromosome segregation protein SMC [Oscillospiraceae bacterium]